MNVVTSRERSSINLVRPEFPDRRTDQRAFLSLIDRVLRQAESDEGLLSYHTDCKSELGRKQNGSYYTPIDVAEFFWSQFFEGMGVRSSSEALEFVRKYTLIEPSAGSGVLIFALLKKLSSMGVHPDALHSMDLRIIDINGAALKYIESQVKMLNDALGADVIRPLLEHVDFRRYKAEAVERPIIFFGNPPFVASPRGSLWKNIYADFLHRCLSADHDTAAVHFIVPLSISFSRDYVALRNSLREGRYSVWASHFDNIPDTLFKSGKPQSENTNKANSQRCTILSAFASNQHSLYSTQLHRWSAAERSQMLSSLPDFVDVTAYSLDQQFIRPASRKIAHYLQSGSYKYQLGDLTNKSGKYELHIASVARNFIAVRDKPGSGINSFAFLNKDSFYKFLGLVTSDAFFVYWRSVGDGFHVTRSNVMGFPVSESLSDAVSVSIPKVRVLWRDREKYQKAKINSGSLVLSYDFSCVALPLISKIGSHVFE